MKAHVKLNSSFNGHLIGWEAELELTEYIFSVTRGFLRGSEKILKLQWFSNNRGSNL